MREVLSLSLQPEIVQTIKNKAKSKGFASVSGYVQYLAELDDDLISAEELLADVKQAQEEYKRGEYFEADSLIDLLQKYGDK